MIKINKITPQTVELFSPDNKSLGFINEYEFNDVRIQINEEKKEGYYCMYNNKKIFIDIDGNILHWEVGFFDLNVKQLNKLFNI